MDYMALKAQNKALNSEEILAHKVRLRSKPVIFSFAISGPCNLKCTHCGYRVFGRTSEQQVSEEVYSQVVTELMPTAYRCHLGGSNWGEMTIAKNFHRFLLDAKKFGVGINLTTNGTRMVDEWFPDLLDTLCVIGFSMEGMDDEFEKVRGFKWRHFLKNVEKVCQGRADHGKKFRVEWRYCAHAGSIHQLPSMIRLAKSIGVHRIQVMNLVPFVASQKYNALFYHRSLANHWFAEGRKVAADLNVEVNVPPDFETGEFGKLTRFQGAKDSRSTGVPENGRVPSERDDGLPLVSCYRPWQACVINEMGIVRPSDIYWRSIGNLRLSSFESVWNGRKYRRLRARINNTPDSICRACRLPQFDNEENTASMQIVPSAKQLMIGSAKSLLKKKPKPAFEGVMDKEFDPNDSKLTFPS